MNEKVWSLELECTEQSARKWGPNKFVQPFQDIFSKIIIVKPYNLDGDMTDYPTHEDCTDDIFILTRVNHRSMQRYTSESGRGRIVDLRKKSSTDSP
jgi:hypothetical protein